MLYNIWFQSPAAGAGRVAIGAAEPLCSPKCRAPSSPPEISPVVCIEWVVAQKPSLDDFSRKESASRVVRPVENGADHSKKEPVLSNALDDLFSMQHQLDVAKRSQNHQQQVHPPSQPVHSDSGIDARRRPGYEQMPKPRSDNFTRISSLSQYKTEIFGEAANEASDLVKLDKKECQVIIKKYGIDQHEFLQLLERWTQTVMEEYIELEESFKITMKSKWDRKELQRITLDASNYQTKTLFDNIKTLKESVLNTQVNRLLKEVLWNDDINADKLKEQTTELIDEALSTIGLIEKVFKFENDKNHSIRKTTSEDDVINSDTLTADHGVESYLKEAKDFLATLRLKNEKPFNVICIAGLEKCGKSTFINALLGYELLPRNIKRCTQITTELRPIDLHNPKLVVIIEYYSSKAFDASIKILPRKDEESDDQYQHRIGTIVDEATAVQLRRDQVSETRDDNKLRVSQKADGSIIEEYYANTEDEKTEIIEKTCHYIQGETYLTIVEKVTIYTEKLPGKNYILKDVPGCDSPIRQHRETAIQAIQEADAFLFLTDGQRPDLTRDEISVIKEIQGGHYQGMSRAIGVITKLDLCHTRKQYLEHYEKGRLELINKGFLKQNIFATTAQVELADQTTTSTNEMQGIIEKINGFDHLVGGFKMATNAINQYISIELPKTHLNQALEIAQQRIIRYVQDAIQFGQKKIPYNITDSAGLDAYIEQQNSIRWGDIFKHERFQPTLEAATTWQHIELNTKRDECTTKIIEYFSAQFEQCTAKMVDEEHMIKEKMYRQHDFSVLQMNRRRVEDHERERAASLMMKAVDDSCTILAKYMYETYVCELEKKLNEICPEQKDIFRTTLKQEECSIEARALIRRIARPVINATLRWPHDYEDCRLEAVKELARVTSLLAFKVCDSETQSQRADTTPVLTRWMSAAFQFCPLDKTLTATSDIPDAIRNILKILS